MLSARKKKRCPRTKEQRKININLTDIKYDSTCITLKLPIAMSCDICKGKMEAMCGMMKKSSRAPKRYRDISQRWNCQQLWLTKYGEHDRNASTVQKHVSVRNYLNISQEVVLDYKTLSLNYGKIQITSQKTNTAIAASTMCHSHPPSKRQKRREDKSNTLTNDSRELVHLSTNMLVREIVATKLNEMVESVEEERKKKEETIPPYPPPVQPTNEEVAPVTVLVPVVSPCKKTTANNTITSNASNLLDTFLKYTYPQNYKSITKAEVSWWSCSRKCPARAATMHWRTRYNLSHLKRFMQIISNNNPEYCSFLIKLFVNSDGKLRESMKDKESESNKIINAIKAFVTNLSKSGCKKKTDKEAIQVILTACTNQLEPTTNKNIVRNAIGMSKKTFMVARKLFSTLIDLPNLCMITTYK